MQVLTEPEVKPETKYSSVELLLEYNSRIIIDCGSTVQDSAADFGQLLIALVT